MADGDPKLKCGNEAVHGKHEWLLLGAFRSECPGYVGAVAVPPETLTARRRTSPRGRKK